jgi:hypothetical protein
MKRLLVIIVLLLCVALTGGFGYLWVRSYWRSDFIQLLVQYDGEPMTFYISTGRGGLGFGAAHVQTLQYSDPGFSRHAGPVGGYARGGWPAQSQWDRLGFSSQSFSTMRGPGFWIGGTAPGWFCTLAPALPIAAFALHWLLRVRRRRKRGLCLRCGYDLRASAGVCPECGRVAV